MPRRSLTLALMLMLPLLAGCGFQPLYGGHARPAMEADLAAVKILPIAEHVGQLLKWRLEKDFNPDGSAVPPRYALHVAITMRQDYLATEPNNVAPRGSLSAAAELALTTLDGKSILYRSKIQSIADYNIDADPYAAEVAMSGAEKAIVEDIGEQIATRISLYFHNKSAAR